MVYMLLSSDYLEHHGILGQKWGIRNGPPYPLSGGRYTAVEKRKIYTERKKGNNIYNKKHFDETISKGTEISTLSYNRDRTKETDMFYATYNEFDKNQYRAMFNRKVPQTLYDENGYAIGTGTFYKYSINNKIVKNVKVASEDSGAKIFLNLYSKNRDFYNFVTDPDRMRAAFVDSKYKFSGYREVRDILEKMDNRHNYTPSEREVRTLYRMFNYVIPNDGSGNARLGKDVATQRAKFFTAAKKQGYGALLDTNDAIYGSFKARAPIIMFDMESAVESSIRRTTKLDKIAGAATTAVRKVLQR